jgi:hypothetical protein
LVQEFRRSGMRRIDFCQEKRLSLSTLARHLRKSKQNSETTAAGGLIRVEIAGVRRSERTLDSGLAVVLSGGRRVEVRTDFDAPTLHRLLTALEPA